MATPSGASDLSAVKQATAASQALNANQGLAAAAAAAIRETKQQEVRGNDLVFVCQKCRRPLRVDTEKPITENALDQFSRGSIDEEELKRQVITEKDDNVIRLLGESFVVLPSQKYSFKTNSAVGLDKQFAALTALFDLASEKCHHDHPICTSCSDQVFTELDKRYQQAEKDRDTYKQYWGRLEAELKAAQERSMPGGGASAAAAAEKDKANAELEKQLRAQLEAIQKERQSLRTEALTLELEQKTLESYEQRYWEDYQRFQLDLDRFNEEQSSVKQKIKVATEQLDRLKHTNVYADAFHISHDGHFGTINGFRLGRLPSQMVEWSEINAALGQVVLLLHTLARQVNFRFTKYKLLPMGSFSKMAKKDELNSLHELYGSNDLSLGRLFWYRRFDTALVWLLFCIRELSEFAAQQDRAFKLRYPIKNEMIGDINIKLQFNNDPKWTKALKYMLTNLKYLLVWCSRRPDG